MTIRIVGFGTGEPDLVAVRGARQLADATLVVAPEALHPAVRELAPDAALEAPPASPLDEARKLATKREEGARICRVFPGDAFVSAGASRLAEALAGLGVPFTVVPGLVADVTAASRLCAAYFRSEDPTPSYAVLEVTHDHLGTFEWEKLATATDTLVVDVVDGDVAEIARTLTFHGRPESTPAACEVAGGEIVAGSLGALARTFASRARGPARLVVGPGARATQKVLPSRALHGKKVLVTRARSQAGELAERLRDEGAIPFFFPVIRLEPPDDPGALRRACGALAEGAYRAVLFTSQNGVARFFEALRAHCLDARAFGGSRVLAIGPATARALELHGIRPDLVASEHVGEGLAADALRLLGEANAGARVLLPRAKVARDVLPDTLRAAGFEVDIVTAYVTERAVPEEAESLRAALRSGEIAAVTLTSPSTAAGLVEALGEGAPALLGGVFVASLGKVTTAAAEALGVRVRITATEATMASLVAALRDHLAPGP